MTEKTPPLSPDKSHYGERASKRYEALADPLRTPSEERLRAKQRLRLELFRMGHDQAGAFKFKVFGRAWRSQFEAGEVMLRDQGQLDVEPLLAERYFVFVNMGELDRFNKEGGHAAGDAALVATVQEIEQAAARAGCTSYELYRYSGNEYLVVLDQTDAETIQDFEDMLRKAEPRVPRIQEPAPLAVVNIRSKDIFAMYNEEARVLPEAARDTTVQEAARETIELLRRFGDHLLEVEKFRVRTKRLLRNVKTPDARRFFETYQAKAFQGSAFSRFEDFEALAVLPSEQRDARIDQEALRFAERRLREHSESMTIEERIVEERVRARLDRPEPTGASIEHIFDPEAPLAIVKQTRGQALLRKLRLQADAATGEDRELAQLSADVEEARRDRGTGLLERSVYYERLETLLAAGKEVSVVFVDMGFLKYFDKVGGRDVGDAALTLAASVIEEAIVKQGVRAEAFRYGGDEFTILVEGGEAQARDVVQAMTRERRAAGRVPPGARSQPAYTPTLLSFNYGIADRSLLERVQADLVRAQISTSNTTDSQRFWNTQAELFTRLADVSVETTKALHRMTLLVNALRDPLVQTDPIRWEQVESFLMYSAKAVFAEQGGIDRVRTWAQSNQSIPRLMPEFMQFIKTCQEANRAQSAQANQVKDLFIETYARERVLETELERAGTGLRSEQLRQELDRVRIERDQLFSHLTDK